MDGCNSLNTTTFGHKLTAASGCFRSFSMPTSRPNNRLMSNSPNDVEQATWNDLPVSVSARLVPRFAWQTASIDLVIGDQVVMRTGGAFKFVGQVASSFEARGTRHVAKLEWARGTLRSFPYQLAVDGIALRTGRVSIENRWIGLWPWLAVGGIVLRDALASAR